jgi:hypothetical protein
LALNVPDSRSAGKSKLTPTVNESSPSTGPTSPDTETLPLWIGQPFSPLTCSVEDSPVKTSALPGNAPGSTAHGQDCGVNTSEPFAHFDHATCWWKTYQVSCLTLTWDEYSETWPRAGMMRNGIVYQQVPLAPITGETACGLWPTPLAEDGTGDCPGERNRDSPHMETEVKLRRGVPVESKQKLTARWLEYLMGYPTDWTLLNR